MLFRPIFLLSSEGENFSHVFFPLKAPSFHAVFFGRLFLACFSQFARGFLEPRGLLRVSHIKHAKPDVSTLYMTGSVSRWRNISMGIFRHTYTDRLFSHRTPRCNTKIFRKYMYTHTNVCEHVCVCTKVTGNLTQAVVSRQSHPNGRIM